MEIKVSPLKILAFNTTLLGTSTQANGLNIVLQEFIREAG